MFELFTIAMFCVFLLFSIILEFPILYALLAGLFLFLMYGRKKGYQWRELTEMSFSGIKTVKNILVTFVLIGILTALWRDAGTISVIVCYAANLIRPPFFLILIFLLNCFVSFLTGTAFGTAATMGVICATMAASMQVSPLLAGGAILSGVYFGDRCSPVSTSALLVAELTKTNIFQNIKNMIRSAGMPFLGACVVYMLFGLLSDSSGEMPDFRRLFGSEFSLSWVAVLPAVVILVLSLMQVNVKISMLASILVSLPICILVQGTSVPELFQLMFTGYHAANQDVAVMLNGGGITSMIRVAAIVCISSSYSGIFQKTGLLKGIKQVIEGFGKRTTPYTAVLLTSVVTGMIACNQTLSIMLTHQLCGQIGEKPETLANHLEDSAVVIAPLIPWSIAGAVPLASIGAPTASVLFACFLYFLPLCRLITYTIRK